VSFKTNADGSESVYELNISYFDAISDPEGGEPLARQVDRFMVSQSIMLALQGVPAIYVHSYFGSRNDYEGVERTGRYRSINRETFRRAELERALRDPASLRARVYRAYRRLLEVRKHHPAFHPNGPQRVLSLDPGVFAVLRTAPDGTERILCLHNVTASDLTLSIDCTKQNLRGSGHWRDLLSDHVVFGDDVFETTLDAYQIVWLAEGTQVGD
jgi:sucrose phosphorylase